MFLPLLQGDRPVVLLDVGNTCAKLYGLSPEISLMQTWPIGGPMEPVWDVLHRWGIVELYWVSSLPASRQTEWRGMLHRNGIKVHDIQRERIKAALAKWDYDTDSLGLDRMLNILAVEHRMLNEGYNHAVLIQAGTATCVEFIRPGH